MTPTDNHNRGFTLIELLVIIAIIATLVAIAIPSLNIARQHATGTVCLSNQRQLYLAWSMYHDDHNGLLVGGSNYFSGDQCTPYRWVEPPLFDEADNPEHTPIPGEAELNLEYRLNGIRAGRLFSYTQDEAIYHCPGDPTFRKEAEPYAAWRSYAIAGLMNGEDFVYRKGNIYSEISDYSYVDYPDGPKTLVCVTRYNQIQSPGKKYIFVEEKLNRHETYNHGSFMLMVNAAPTGWWDYPADYHHNQSTLSFADGHAENHKWTDPRTRTLMKGSYQAISSEQPDNADLEWMIAGYIPAP